MITEAKWIWLGEGIHPKLQSSPYTVYCAASDFDPYCVVEAARAYRLMKTAVKLRIDVCADTVYKLWINGKYTGSGPVYSGGDYGSVMPMKNRYYSTYELDADPETLSIRALIRKNPSCGDESSCGHGGFILSCEIEYDDGSREYVFTDEKWDVRTLPSRKSDLETDLTLIPGEWEKARVINYPASLIKSPIPNLSEERIYPAHREMFVCPPHSSARFCVEFAMIYSAYASFSADGESYEISVGMLETGDEPEQSEIVTAKGHCDYVSMRYGSAGKLLLDVSNNGGSDVKISDVSLIFRHYPVTHRGNFACSDGELNNIYSLCVHTLGICRQDLHLDSPRHREPLGCTGDYYIQALIEYFAFGDSALTRFDIVRTAKYLDENDGKMFHTSYSLIWLSMIRDYYLFTGDASVFDETESAMNKLLDRFAEYTGSSGTLERAPDYMFLDWTKADGFDLHHPPKALGQACLTAFYYNALDIASKFYALRGNNRLRSVYRLRADAVKKGFNDSFYDRERGLYSAGAGTPDRVPCGMWLPENVNKKYFLPHENILAALFGLCDSDTAKRILRTVAGDETLGVIQPYFMHYLLDAVYKYNLFGELGLPLIKRWTKLVTECPKGLAEGWGDFRGDHSHAWGGTPGYQLPRALLGFEMVKPGFAEIKLSPKLYGLDYAYISVPTPFGLMECRLENDRKPEITIPKEIKYTIV